MTLAISKTRSAVGIHAHSVSVEVHLSNGLPSFSLVGLPETAVKESRDRVRSAIMNSQFEFPCRRITVNLGPANLPKIGSGFDLPIAISILAASGQIPSTALSTHEFIAELALDGSLRGVSSIVPMVLAAHKEQQQLIIALANAQEASLISQQWVYAATSLRAVCNYLCNNTPLEPLPERPISTISSESIDWSDVKGQMHAKEALKIAACGGHNVLLCGPPGSGKTMLAKRFVTLLPRLSEDQALECAAIYSIHGKMPNYEQWQTPACRAPHHTASHVALVGGGNPPKPGEISLAHHGVLFLDELPEFNRQVLETLRQPLESGQICLSIAAMTVDYPAQFQLMAAMNPCPCGQLGNPHANCICSSDKIQRYLGKLSAPFLDRLDMQVNVQALSFETMIKTNTETKPQSAGIRDFVAQIRDLQISRQGCINARLSSPDCEKVCALNQEDQSYLAHMLSKLKVSARGFHRLLKVSRTIADMRSAAQVTRQDLQQALSYKQAINNGLSMPL